MYIDLKIIHHCCFLYFAMFVKHTVLSTFSSVVSWMEAVLDEQLPPTTELEESLRHGVHLARLALRLRPDTSRRVYDPELSRYAARGLQFRHTDNINLWTQTMQQMGLPQTFIPTTTDVYERKNMPKVVYCIHALSLFAFKLGRAPQMLDLLGKAVFTGEMRNRAARGLPPELVVRSVH